MNKTAFLFVLCGFLLISPLVSAYTNEEECGFCKNEPDCCAQIRETKDATECSWPIRGYCNPNTCSQAEGNKQKCGWYWVFHNANDNEYHIGTNSPNGYGCMIGDTEATMHPRCDPTPIPTMKPTITPYPTQRPPTIIPTRMPPPPTSAPLPTSVPVPTVFIIPSATVLPTVQPAPYQPPPDTLPAFQIPLLSVPCTTTVEKPDAVTRLVQEIGMRDKMLEEAINTQLFRLLYSVTSMLHI